VAEEDCKTIELINEADGKPVSQGTSMLDLATDPRSIDFTPSKRPNKGKSVLGIYVVGSDTRRMCFGDPGGSRPTGFSSGPGSAVTLAAYKREKA
jgi:uncharacterized protein (TIGR03067 family)